MFANPRFGMHAGVIVAVEKVGGCMVECARFWICPEQCSISFSAVLCKQLVCISFLGSVFS